MKKVVIELPDGYDDIISITAIGCRIYGNIAIVPRAFDLCKGDNIKIYKDENGEIQFTQN